MDSLTPTLTSFDDINVNCLSHETPAVGVCGDSLCKERKFFCMKCINLNETCITSGKHELVTLSELFYRFFIKQETKAIDLEEINFLMEALKEIDRMEITNNLVEFTKRYQNEIALKVDYFMTSLQTKIDSSKGNNLKYLEKFLTILTNAKNENENMEKILNHKIPECLLNMNPQKIKEFLTSDAFSKQEKEDCVKTIKLLSNYDNISKTISAADDIIQLNKMTSTDEMNKLEEKIEEKLKEMENKILKQIDDLEKNLIPSKEVGIVTKTSIDKFTTDPSNLKFKMDICETAHKSNSIDSVFCVFKSFKGDCYVAWGTPTFTVEVYDLKLEKIVKTITSAHTSTIFSCRHYPDKKGKRDFLVTSSYDKSIKVWSVKDNWTNIINIPSAHTGYYIYSVCILINDIDNKNYIISAAPNEYTKVWDFSGKYIRDFGVNTESTYFIDCWMDTKNKKYYILNANSTDVKSYDFKTGLLYKSYKGTPATWHMSALINEVKNSCLLIESDGNGNIRIWDFHEANLLKSIATTGINLRGICLWNDNYLFSAGSDYQLKLYDIKNAVFVKSFTGHSSTACAVEKIVHPKYGDCLVSHALDGKLKLWVSK